MFEQQNSASILTRLVNGFRPQGVAKQEGTFVYEAMAPMAIELSQAYTDMDRVLTQGFAQTSTGSYLDLRAGEHGVTRKPPIAAHGIVQVKGDVGVVIPAKTAFATKNGSMFLALSDAEIGSAGMASVNVVAAESGTSGNIPANAIVSVVGSIPGIQLVQNENAFTDGYDGETDEALLGRLLTKVRKPATSGNSNQYRLWAMEVTGISDAKVFPLWNGNGTVKVVLLDDERRAPSTALVTEVTEHIAGVRPIGANVTVAAATEVPMNLVVEVDLVAGVTLEEATALISSEVQRYLKGLSFTDPIVRFARIANVILDTATVVDYGSLKINGSTENIAIPDGSVAVLGTVTVT
ncbi:hypothetical protein BVG16_05640 [Paenibacillus selenitireducens]|uniref:Uncharacterized protein n=1 Tax=Paenibacillus selenitireducens TaxID=1324314 RepID=A0A1T2XKG9_9BACL|nr:baseplate J/gp47 family protein [Paenibacillus selenitireducens]OPA80226.1 hypothetical protein BVG16_05640 [Paenibacillus selenitireducens]